jgi:hypothetical protein
LKDLRIDGRIILKVSFKKWDRGVNWIWIKTGRVEDSCENGNELHNVYNGHFMVSFNAITFIRCFFFANQERISEMHHGFLH